MTTGRINQISIDLVLYFVVDDFEGSPVEFRDKSPQKSNIWYTEARTHQANGTSLIADAGTQRLGFDDLF